MGQRRDFGFWMGWLVAAGTAGLFLLAVASFMFASKTMCTGAQGEHCVREWVSALGAWIALIAAVPTVAVLLVQVADAKQHHIDNAMIILRRRRSLCERVIRLEFEYLEFIKGSETHWRTASFDGSEDMIDAARIELGLLESTVEKTTFEQFDSEIDIPAISPTRLLDRIERLRLKIKSREIHANELYGSEQLCFEMERLYGDCEAMLIDAGQKARDFLNDTAHLVRLPKEERRSTAHV